MNGINGTVICQANTGNSVAIGTDGGKWIVNSTNEGNFATAQFLDGGKTIMLSNAEDVVSSSGTGVYFL